MFVYGLYRYNQCGDRIGGFRNVLRKEYMAGLSQFANFFHLTCFQPLFASAKQNRLYYLFIYYIQKTEDFAYRVSFVFIIVCSPPELENI